MLNEAVSLFSNCGAGDWGFREAGFRFAAMAELEEDRLELCRWNHQQLPDGNRLAEENFVPGDLRKTWTTVVNRFEESVSRDTAPSLLSACPPCQGMSTARSGIGDGDDLESGDQDERNLLVKVIADVAEKLEPKVIVVENVPAFLTRKVPHPETEVGVSAARLLYHDLEDDYTPFPFLADLADYDVPQHRQRTFLTFVRDDQPFLNFLEDSGLYPYPTPEEQIELSDFLDEHADEFPELDARENPRGEDPMDQVPRWSKEQYRMVAAIEDPGGSAWENGCDVCGEEDIHEDLAKCPNCEEVLPRPTVKKKGEEPRLVKGFRRSSYRRMPLDQPAPTVTTASNRIGSNYNIHPTENRLLTPKECARLQGFPPDFRWRDPETEEHALDRWGVNEVRAMIGEAVPPTYTKKHGEVLLKLLNNEARADDLISATDERCVNAVETLGLS